MQKKFHILEGEERDKLREELFLKYGSKPSFKKQLIYHWKRFSWLFVVCGAKAIKRGMDILVSLLLLVILSPLMILIALIIKLSDGGPILYVTERVGLWGKEFRFPKFRTMVVNAESIKKELLPFNVHKEGVTFKMRQDPRITTIGKFLRKTSLDELPQLWCTFKGDMSLVGPRPPLPSEVAQYTLEQRGRLDVRPGLTCLWQVSGRSEIPFSKQVKLDREYIESQSFWVDIKILLKTIPAILMGRGAY